MGRAQGRAGQDTVSSPLARSKLFPRPWRLRAILASWLAACTNTRILQVNFLLRCQAVARPLPRIAPRVSWHSRARVRPHVLTPVRARARSTHVRNVSWRLSLAVERDRSLARSFIRSLAR